MGKHWKLFIFVVFTAVLLLLWLFLAEEDVLSFAYIQKHHQALKQSVSSHYTRSATIYILLYMTTALMIPGAIVLTIAGGVFFGTLPAICFVNVGSALGSAVAFFVTRHLLGAWLQKNYHSQLDVLNRELDLHGRYYLITLRIVPVLPAFLLNYLVGLTKISFRTFIWTSSVGVLPGSFVYAYAGSRLNDVRDPGDIMSWPIMTALLLLGLFSLLPVLAKHVPKLWR